jgi:hypothetical protein
VQSGSIAGGAAQTGGSSVSCTADIRPFVEDMERGQRVPLTPGRYELHVKGADVDVQPMSDGWRIIDRGGSSTRIAYEIFDGKRNNVVFHDEVTLACSGSPGGTELTSAPAASSTAPAETAVTHPPSNPDQVHTDRPWDGNAWTISLFGGTSYLRPAGLAFGNGADTQDASLFGLRNVAGMAVGLSGAYERPGIYSSISPHVAWVGVGNGTLVEYGVMSTVAAALHIGDTSLYLGPHAHLGTYQLFGDAATTWGTRAAFSVGAAVGGRLHFRGEDGKAWVLGGELVAPVSGSEPWFLVASIGWGGAT